MSTANPKKSKKVYIECGRATADLENFTITYHFSRNAPVLKLHRGTWFDRDKKNFLQPIAAEDADKIEALYQVNVFRGIKYFCLQGFDTHVRFSVESALSHEFFGGWKTIHPSGGGYSIRIQR